MFSCINAATLDYILLQALGDQHCAATLDYILLQALGDQYFVIAPIRQNVSVTQNVCTTRESLQTTAWLGLQ